MKLVRPSAVVSQTTGSRPNIGFCHGQRFAIVEGFDGCELLGVFLEEIGQIDQVLPSLVGCHFAPALLKRLAGYGDGNVDIFLCGFVDGDNGLLGRGIDGLKGLALGAFDEFVVDEPKNYGLAGVASSLAVISPVPT